MKCSYPLCSKSHEKGFRLLKDSNGKWKCWDHLSEKEKENYIRHYNNTVPAERRAMTQREADKSDIWW